MKIHALSIFDNLQNCSNHTNLNQVCIKTNQIEVIRFKKVILLVGTLV